MHCFQQELTEDTYSREVEISFPSCAPDRTPRLSTLLGYAVAAGGADYAARSLTFERLCEMRQVFLLSRICLRVHQMPTLGDVLNIVTWEEGVQSVHMQRGCFMQKETGEIVASARSQWILVDPENHKILRPSAFTAREIGDKKVTLDCPSPGKLSVPEGDHIALGRRLVVWSDLDGNGHVYSGNYADIFWDFLPIDLQRKHFREFAVNYHKEAVLGGELDLSGYREDGAFTMTGAGNGETCFTARCVFAD